MSDTAIASQHRIQPRVYALLFFAQYLLFAPLHLFLFSSSGLLDLAVAVAVTWALGRIRRRWGATGAALTALASAAAWFVPGRILLDASPWLWASAPGAIASGFLLRRRPVFDRAAGVGAVFALVMCLGIYDQQAGERPDEAARRDAGIAGIGRVEVDATKTTGLRHARRIFFHPDGVRYYVLMGIDWEYDDPCVAEVTRESGAVRLFGPSPAHALAFDNEGRRLIISHPRRGKLIAYDWDTLAPVGETKARRALKFRVSGDGRSMWVLAEHHPVMSRWTVEGINVFIAAENLGSLMPITLVVDEPSGRLFMASGYMHPFNRMVELDAKTLELRRESRIGWLPVWSMTADADARRLYMARSLSARIDVFDIERFGIVSSLPAPIGAYALAVDGRGRLWAGSFSNGELWAIDTGNGRVLWRGFVGRRIRDIQPDPVSGRLFVLSSLGVTSIDPNRLEP